MSVALIVIELTLLVPFFAWGVFALHGRLRRHHETTILADGSTLLALLVFFVCQVLLMRSWMRQDGIYYLFALLGLFVSTAALYTHTAVSFFSHLVVDMVTLGHRSAPEGPRLGPALELESRKDYEGALIEYQALARAHPKNAELHTRIAENLLRLARPEEAVIWLERAVANGNAPERALPALNRLCEVYEHTLERPDAARNAIAEYLERFPGAGAAATLEARLDRLGNRPPEAPKPALEPLEIQPLNDADLEAAESGEEAESAESAAGDGGGGGEEHAVEPIESPLEAASEAELPEAAGTAEPSELQGPSPNLIPMDEMPLDGSPLDSE